MYFEVVKFVILIMMILKILDLIKGKGYCPEGFRTITSYCPEPLSNVLVGHASGCWLSALGAGVPYNREKKRK